MTTKRVRSPNYPSLSLVEAVPRIKAIYEREHTHPADGDTIAQALGYKGKNGASDSVLSALKKYGLLEDVGNREYKLSSNAIDLILHERGEPERVKAVSEAAFTPPLFAELRHELGIDPPPSENNLRIRLLKRGFNPRSVSEAIRAYLDTIDFLSQEAGEHLSTEQIKFAVDAQRKDASVSTQHRPSSFSEQATALPQTMQQLARPNATTPREDAALVFRISRDSEARVSFTGAVTQEAVEKLRVLLLASMDTFPTQQELSQNLHPPSEGTDRSQPAHDNDNLKEGFGGHDRSKDEGDEVEPSLHGFEPSGD